MAYKIEFSAMAEMKMDEIADYLRRNDYDKEILTKIKREIVEKLSENPHAWKLAENIPAHLEDVRQVQILKKNIVYYKVLPGKVTILTIRAGRMTAEF